MVLVDNREGVGERPTSFLLYNPSVVEIKSRYYNDIRRYSVQKEAISTLDEFIEMITESHRIVNKQVLISYTDPIEKDELPITNDNNLRKAISTSKNMLRVQIFKHSDADMMYQRATPTIKMQGLQIGLPKEFRQVSAVVDADILPQWKRRVKLLKHSSDKPLGFYIRDGTNVSVTPNGVEKKTGIFISRLLPGGLAESTGLLSVGDEVLEVNGIQLEGKTLDQVTEMMIANSQNLIITVKPTTNQPKQNMRSHRPYSSVQYRIKAAQKKNIEKGEPVKHVRAGSTPATGADDVRRDTLNWASSSDKSIKHPNDASAS